MILALSGLGVVVVGAAVSALLRRGSRTREPAYEDAVVSSSLSARKIAFADPPPLPAAEPPSDKALVARAQALADAKPSEVAPALNEIVKSTRDPAVLAVAAGVAAKLPPEDAGRILAEIAAKGEAAPPYAYLQLARNLADRGQAREAAKVYEDGLARHPMDFPLREACARDLARQGRTQDAVAVCLKDVGAGKDTRPNAMRRLILAGEILYAAGEKDQARATWERLVSFAETEGEGQRYVEQILAQHNIAR